MKRSFGKLLPASLAAFVLASFAMAPTLTPRAAVAAAEVAVAVAVAALAAAVVAVAAAAVLRAGGGGGGRQQAQVNNSQGRCPHQQRPQHQRQQRQRRARTSTSMSTAGCCGGGWDNDYHPVARGRGGGRCRRRDVRRRRLDGAQRAAKLRAGELRRHGLSAVRKHLVSAPGIAVRRGQSAELIVRIY